MLVQISAWLTAHPFLATILWPIVTALVTALFHWADTSSVPVIAQVVRVLKVIGVDGPKVLSWLWAAMGPKPPQDPPAPPPIVKPLINPRDVLPKIGGAAAIILGFAFAAPIVTMPFLGCKNFTAKQATNTALDALTAACLLENATKLEGDDAVIAFCGVEPQLADAAKKLLGGARIAATHSVGLAKCDAGAK